MSKLIFSLDVESNGLYGDGFAFAVVVIDVKTGQMIDKQTGYYREFVVTDEFAKINVLPYLKNLEICYSLKELRNLFWKIYIKYFSEESPYFKKVDFIVDNGFPVESNFLNSCIIDNFDRIKNSPFPVYDFATILRSKNISNNMDRMNYIKMNEEKHNPINDALASAKCWLLFIS